MQHNLSQVDARLAAYRMAQSPSSTPPKRWAVIKANAYGHGIDAALRGFAQADGLAMIDIVDAVYCRTQGWQKPLLLLEGFFQPQDLPVLQAYQIATAVHSDYQLQALAQLAPSAQPLSVWLKINTGMQRLGFSPSAVPATLETLHRLHQQGRLHYEGAMCHFANADWSDEDVLQSVQQMQALHAQWPALGDCFSLCNSAASLRYPAFAYIGAHNWVRPGICLYGATPFHTEQPGLPALQLQATMTLQSQIIATQTLKAGDSVGYGATFIAQRPMRIGVVACGYADGYPRSATVQTPVTVAGQASHVVGRVSMDMLMVNISDIPQAQVGSPVVLWGEGGPSIDAVAQSSARIAYELMCGLTRRVPVVLK